MDALIVAIYTFVSFFLFFIVGPLLIVFAIACFIEQARIIREHTKRRGK